MMVSRAFKIRWLLFSILFVCTGSLFTTIHAEAILCKAFLAELEEVSGRELRLKDPSTLSSDVEALNETINSLDALARVYADEASSLNRLLDQYSTSPGVERFSKPSDAFFRFITLGIMNPLKSRVLNAKWTAEDHAKLFNRLKGIVTDLQNIGQRLAEVDSRSNDVRVYEWLLTRANKIMDSIIAKAGESQSNLIEIDYSESEVSNLENEIREMQAFLLSGEKRNPLVLRLNLRIQEIEEDGVDSNVDQLLGRDMDISHSIMLRRLANQYGIPLEDLVARFKQLDEMGENLDREGDTLYDPYIIYLLSVGLEMGLPNSELMRRFKEIDDAGQRTEEDWTLQDEAVVQFVKMQIVSGDSTEALVRESIEIHDRVEDSSVEISLEDHEIVQLMQTRRMLGLSIDQVVDRFIEISKLGQDEAKGLYIDGEASLALTRLSFQSFGDQGYGSANKSISNFSRAARQIEKELENGEFEDPDIVRFMWLARKYQLTYGQLAQILKRAYQLTGDDLYYDREIFARLDLAFAAKIKSSSTPETISDDEIWEAIQIPSVETRTLEEWVFSETQRELYEDDSGDDELFFNDEDDSDDFLTGGMTFNLATGGGIDHNLVTPW